MVCINLSVEWSVYQMVCINVSVEWSIYHMVYIILSVEWSLYQNYVLVRVQLFQQFPVLFESIEEYISIHSLHDIDPRTAF